MVVSYGSRTVESTVQEISLSDAMGNGALAAAASTTCWSHFLRGTDDMGSFWTKTVWCANDNAVLTYKNVTEDADQVNWPWVLRDHDAGTTAGGVGHTYHEDVGRAKFELCSPGIDCTGVLDIIKIWKEQYGDGRTDSEVTYEAE